jgi:hypothetical protein
MKKLPVMSEVGTEMHEEQRSDPLMWQRFFNDLLSMPSGIRVA